MRLTYSPLVSEATGAIGAYQVENRQGQPYLRRKQPRNSSSSPRQQDFRALMYNADIFWTLAPASFQYIYQQAAEIYPIDARTWFIHRFITSLKTGANMATFGPYPNLGIRGSIAAANLQYNSAGSTFTVTYKVPPGFITIQPFVLQERNLNPLFPQAHSDWNISRSTTYNSVTHVLTANPVEIGIAYKYNIVGVAIRNDGLWLTTAGAGFLGTALA